MFGPVRLTLVAFGWRALGGCGPGMFPGGPGGASQGACGVALVDSLGGVLRPYEGVGRPANNGAEDVRPTDPTRGLESLAHLRGLAGRRCLGKERVFLLFVDLHMYLGVFECSVMFLISISPAGVWACVSRQPCRGRGRRRNERKK